MFVIGFIEPPSFRMWFPLSNPIPTRNNPKELRSCGLPLPLSGFRSNFVFRGNDNSHYTYSKIIYKSFLFSFHNCVPTESFPTFP